MARYSEAYLDCEAAGPFPGRIDPWAEAGYYFQQVHHGMLTHLLTQVQRPLRQLGYLAGIEASLQIAQGREPDLHVRHTTPQPPPPPTLTASRYTEAAEAIAADAGVEVDTLTLGALYIQAEDDGALVTVVEIISPSNKRKGVSDYQDYRARLLRAGVNIMEVDATRSRLRLTAASHAYHVAVHLPGELPRIIGVDFGMAFRRCALPLRAEVIGIEPQAAYDHAYRAASIAAQIEGDRRYALAALPFPSLVSDTQKAVLERQIADWRAVLLRLRTEGSAT